MKKENFIKAINAIITQNRREMNFSRAIQEFSSSQIVTDISSGFCETIIEILESEMDDSNAHGSTISWWIYDSPQSGNNTDNAYIEDVITGFRWPVKTPEQLYDYLRDIQLDVNNSGC
jgi:hypothetical protein